MVFSSTVFLYVFLPLVLACYCVSPKGFRNPILILASLGFYAWGESHSFAILIVSILVNWAFGMLVGSDRAGLSRWSLYCGVAFNLALLCYFKYFNFFVSGYNASLGALTHLPAAVRDIALPLGISFFTFHSISYLVDIRRHQAKALKNPLEMGLYICFFPQLVAGPIIRYHDIAEQILARTNTVDRFASGVERFVYGLGKKILVANVLGAAADACFAVEPGRLSGAEAWLGVVCYTLQIYFDFSGYSDMAIGLARMFGFELPENFNYPYIAQSVRHFWRRWHLSLSTWFRDYLYIPLGGARKGVWRTRANLFAVFVLCGLWHGASGNFLFWGVYHGALLMLERGPFGALLDRLPRPVGHAYTVFAVAIGWVLFRASSFDHAFGYLAALFGAGDGAGLDPSCALLMTNQFYATLALGLLLSTPACTCLAGDWKRRVFPAHSEESSSLAWMQRLLPNGAPLPVRLTATGAVLFLSLSQLTISMYNPFIYYRF